LPATRPAPAPSAGPEPAVAAEHLEHRYGERVALAGISFTVAPETICGFLGPNGGGKSTLFRILSTMIEPTGGEVRLLGRDPRRSYREIRRELGVVFQAPSLDPMLSCRENLVHQGHLYGLSGRGLTARIDAVSALLGVADRLGDRTADLSGGLRRRVEIAKALLHHPRLILMDEPTTGLDPAARLDLWSHLEELRREESVTIAFTTHLMAEAERCDRLALLDRGHLVAHDSPSALKNLIQGEVVTVDTATPESTATQVAEAFGVTTTLVGNRIRIETPSGAHLAGEILDRFGEDVHGVTVGRPGLEDVFIQLTGHRFEGEPEPAPETGRKKRRRRS